MEPMELTIKRKTNCEKLLHTLNALLGNSADVYVTFEPKEILPKTSHSQTDLPYVDLDPIPVLVISGDGKKFGRISSLLAKGDIAHSIIPDQKYPNEEVIAIDTRTQPDLTSKIAGLKKIAQEMKASKSVGRVDSSITLEGQKQKGKSE